jgi:hypothetical protein
MADDDERETEQDEGESQPETTSSMVTADVVNAVVQAGVVDGGVHQHLPVPRQPAPTPRQLSCGTAGFVSCTDQLAALDQVLTLSEGPCQGMAARAEGRRR